MSIIYFGRCNSDGTLIQTPDLSRGLYANYAYANDPAQYNWACPGSGNMEIKSLAFYGYNKGAADHHVKMMVFSNDKSTQILLSGAITIATGQNTYAWREISGLSGINLVGGTNYIISAISDSDDMVFGADGAGAVRGYGYDGGHSYASPPPDLVGLVNSGNYLWPIFRCGVEEVASGAGGPIMGGSILRGPIMGGMVLR